MKRCIIRHIMLIVVAVWNITAVSAMDYYTISAFEGLPSNTVGAIKKDSLGFVWIGTKLGLCRFDGCEVKTYPAMTDDIWSIEELDSDTLLVGTQSGLQYFSRKTNVAVKLDLPATIVKSIRKIDDRRFLIGTEAGLYMVENGDCKQIMLETGLSLCNHVTSIIREDRHVYWFSTADGVGRIDIRTMKPVIYRMPEGMTNSNFFICLTRVGNSVYLGSFNKGVFRFDMSDKVFSKVDGFEHNLIMTIDAQEDCLFVGTNGQGLKVMSLRDGKITRVSYKGKVWNSVRSNTITAFLYDAGIHWVGTQFGGISYTPRIGAKFSVYDKNDFFSADYRVRSFYMFPNGDKLIGTRTGLFFVEERTGNVKNYSVTDRSCGLRSDIIVFINRVGGKVLIGTYGGGLHVFNEHTRTLEDFSQEEFFLYGCIFCCVQDASGYFWFASHSGLYQSTPDGHILKKYDTMNSALPTNAILSLSFDEMNRLWIGSRFGLLLLDIATGKMRIDCFDKPVKGEIHYLQESMQKDMWVGTGNGLYKIGMDLKVKEHFTAEDILPNNIVSCIREDKDSMLWIACEREIVRYNPANGQHYTYRRQDGLTGLEFNNMVFVSNDSTIWWPNEGGLVYTSLKRLDAKRYFTSNPTITSFFISDREYDFPYADLPEGIVLSPEDNSIRFKISNMDYTLPYANVYEYKLEGEDKEWRQQTGLDEVEYKNLHSGHYVFKLRVPGTETVVRSVDVYVRKSYSVMIGLLATVIIVGILVVYFCYRIWRLKKRMMNERMILSKAHEQGKGKKSVLPEMKVNGMLDNLLAYMKDERPYLNPKLSIGNVAAKLDCTETELSQLLNSHMNVNFANFVNVYRVDEIKKRMTQENLSRYTLKALAEQCGFSSKATFYRVFKNISGMTPLEYCKKQNLEIRENW